MALSEAREERCSRDPRAAPRIEVLSPADVDAGLALSKAAGWNQTAADWALFIERGRTIGCRDAAGGLVATAAALPYGTQAAWISMVLVAEGWRHRGLASALLRDCIAHLQAAGTRPLLDATPAGAAVYRGLGFAAGFELERWQSSRPRGVAAAAGADGPSDASDAAAAPRAAAATDIDRMASLDRSASGLDRRFLLESFLSRTGTQAWLAADGRGFVIARAGRRATQLGPLVAAGAAQAIALLGAARAAAKAPVFLDVPTSQGEIAAWLQAQGFSRQRPFVRMAFGAAPVPGLAKSAFVVAGPEFG
jgi:ribosomal protein S18 acetylase RimI-like enzyme